LNNIIVIATITIKEEFVEEVYKELVKLYKYTHLNDKGCINYELHRDLNDTNTFVFIEKWENENYLELHLKTEYFAKCISNIENKVIDLNIKKLNHLNL
jgi:quinol monooxygenase YgiN